VTREEAPQRADPDRRAALGEHGLPLDQGDVLLRLNALEDEPGMRLDPRGAPVAALYLRGGRTVPDR